MIVHARLRATGRALPLAGERRSGLFTWWLAQAKTKVRGKVDAKSDKIKEHAVDWVKDLASVSRDFLS